MNKSYMTGKLSLMALLMCVLTVFSSCEKDYKLELPLAVTQNSLNLGAGGGTTHVLVYSTGNWTATLKDEADASWATIEQGSGKENGEFIFTYAVNPSIQRKAVVVITSGSNTEEIEMVQSGYLNSPELVLMKKALALPTWESMPAVGFNTNMGLALDRVKTKVEYGDAENEDEKLIAATEENPGWLTDVTVTEDLVTFKVAPNNDGATRKARLTVSVYNNVSKRTYSASTIVSQEAEAGYFRFVNSETPAEVESFAKPARFDWATNMEMFFDKTSVAVNYQEPGEEWITDMVLTPEGIEANIQESKYDGERHATITVTYSGAEGTVTAKRDVVQARPALEIPFADLRARLTAAGTLALEKDYIMAQVISEPGNPNLETNPHTAWNMVDLTENDKTAYIQSLDGKYGFRVKMDSADDATALPRYATVKLSLADLTLEREDNPARYTLRGFTPINVLECEPGNASMLPTKEKYIKDLTDDDVYTYVTFKDMEVAFRYGAWGNHHEGFALKTDVNPIGNATQTRNDCMPRYFRDIKGGTIPMIINAQVPWRRPGSYVPKGSGTIKGIVVYSPLSNYNKNNEMGRYQFRVLDKSEINLDANTSSFSNIIAEWQWTGGSSTIMVDGSSDRVLNANLGNGKMSTSATPEGALKSLTTSFLYKSFPTSSTTEYLAFRYNAKWWNFTKNEGHNVSWTFSTEGITGTDRHLSFAMVASIGKQAQPNNGSPARWNLEYSTDGENFTVLKKDFYLYPSPIFAYTLGDIPAGNPEYVFDLPDSLLGQKSVTVRIKATSRKFATSAGIEAGTITNGNATTDVATYLRFESIVIRYNK